jgi:hypothetical protein
MVERYGSVRRIARHNLRADWQSATISGLRTPRAEVATRQLQSIFLIWHCVNAGEPQMSKMDDFFGAMSRDQHANRFDSASEKILDEIYAALQNEPAISERDDED